MAYPSSGDYYFYPSEGWSYNRNGDMAVCVEPKDKTKTTYGAVPTTVTFTSSNNDWNITGSYYVDRAVFTNCTNMTTAPTIPSTVTEIIDFSNCTSLTTWPSLPANLRGLDLTNTQITTISSFPSTYLRFLDLTGNTQLTTLPASFPSTLKQLYLADCTSLTSIPSLPANIESLSSAFRNCTSLVTAPIIPSKVTNLYRCFYNCSSLSGIVTINSEPTNYTNIFYGTTNLIVLKGNSSKLAAIAETRSNVYVYSLNANLSATRREATPTTVDISVTVSRFKGGNDRLTSLILKKDGNSQNVTWSDSTLTMSSATKTFTTTLTNVLEGDSPTLSVVASDAYGTSTEISIRVPVAFYTIDVKAGGKEIAFGAIADDDTTNYPDGLFKCQMNFVDMKLVGEIKAYAGVTVPNGWLLCDGSEVAVSSYPLLYAAIGNLWGTPSDSDHFVLPNLNGKVPVGYDSSQTEFDTVGEAGGAKTVTLTANEIPAHTHGSRGFDESSSANFYYGNQSSDASGLIRMTHSSNRQYKFDGTSSNSWAKLRLVWSHTHDSVGGGGAHNNLQPYAVVKYIICAV